MEMMEYKLTTVLESHSDIPMYVKLSIIQDNGKGVIQNYLHNLNPPMTHLQLSTRSVLLTTSMVAKVCGFCNDQ